MKFIKEHKWRLLFSSLITLLPMAFGAVTWETLSKKLSLYWGLEKGASTSFHPFYFVYFMPIVLLLIHYFALFFTAKENKNQSKKVTKLLFWLLPAISLYSNGIVYAACFGMPLEPFILMVGFLGILFIIVGNYLPKCRQSRTVGIKIKWTLEDEENWAVTHRFGGKVFVICGVIALLSVFLPAKISTVLVGIDLLGAVLLPVIYSYRYHQKQGKAGHVSKKSDELSEKKFGKSTAIAFTAFFAALAVFLSVLLFSGDVNVNLSEESFEINASFHSDMTVKYSDIQSMEYRESDHIGSRIFGVGSPRLSVGNFQNKEFGEYVRYSYTACKACIVLINRQGEELVINQKDTEQTKALYEELLARMEASKGAQQ